MNTALALDTDHDVDTDRDVWLDARRDEAIDAQDEALHVEESYTDVGSHEWG